MEQVTDMQGKSYLEMVIGHILLYVVNMLGGGVGKYCNARTLTFRIGCCLYNVQ